MPTGKCTGCGYTTNSATSNWWSIEDSKFGLATECYVRWNKKGNPIRGCAYKKARKFQKRFADEMLSQW